MDHAGTQVDPEALLAHGDFVRAIARSLLWDEHAAEDVVQQTWLAALGAPVGATRGWLGAVARNLAIKRLRTDRRRLTREAIAARPETAPSDVQVLERERLRRSVVDEVLALPDPYRATVLLRFFENLPPRDVARRMDVPVETVRTRTRRAIEMLRARLEVRHGSERGALCGALALLARGSRRAAPSTVAATAGIGGMLMGMKALAVGAVVLVGAVAAWLLWPRDDAAVPPRSDAAPAALAGSDAKAAPIRARTAVADESAAAAVAIAPAPSREPAVRGRVVDSQGAAVSGAEVSFLVGEPKRDDRGNLDTGELFRVATDAEGRFEKKMAAGAKCRVFLQPFGDPAFEEKRNDDRDVVAPAEGVEFVVARRPTATFVISAYDTADGKRISQYACSFGQRIVRQRPIGPDGTTEARVRLNDALGDDVHVTVRAGGASAERTVAVREGDRVDLRFDLQLEGEIHGRVVDGTGRPVANALAFLGEEHVARGDEPFKPFDEKRVREGARTDADGRFALKGAGRWITVWHTDGGPVTVARGDAGNVVLPARGTIRGVLRGSDGTPLANTKLYLDRIRETTSGSDGRFEFTGVEPGTRGISLSGGKPKAYVAVRVAPGATVDAEIRPGLPTVSIVWPGRTNLGRFVALVPVAAVGTLGLGQPSEGAIAVTDILPGSYILLGEGCGVATVEIGGANATASVGTGEIVLHAKPKTRLWVVPEGAGYLARLLAGRMAGAGVPADGVQRVTGLVPGRYDVGVELDGLRATVEVRDAPVEVTIE